MSHELETSATARVLRGLPARAREDLGAADEVLIVIDGVVAAASTLMDPTDTRRWDHKIDWVLDGFEEVGRAYGPRIAEWISALDEDTLRAVSARYARQGYLAYVQKMIGEAAFRRLRQALTSDIDVVGAAVHRGIEALMPYAIALEGVADVLTEDQVRRVMDFNPAGGFMLDLVFKLFELLDLAVDSVALPEGLEALTRIRAGSPGPTEIVSLAATLRERVSGQSRALIRDLNAVLDRKFSGARDALAYSADSNSQAANSLIEFIDRLLRQAYADEEVLAWLSANYPEQDDLTYVEQSTGTLRPTKRGQALCLVHAGVDVAQKSELHVLMATSVSTIRQKLQRIKHADEGTDEERETITQCIIALEAFVHLGIRLGWSLVPDDGLVDLRSRLDPRPHGSNSLVIESA